MLPFTPAKQFVGLDRNPPPPSVPVEEEAKMKNPAKYEVNHPMHSSGPKFSNLTEALAYVRHCITNGGETSMTISKLS